MNCLSSQHIGEKRHTGTSICHRKQEWLRVLELKIFIFKLLAVDRLPTGAIASSEVTPLDHEILDDAMKARIYRFSDEEKRNNS